ncbi:related to sugar kinases, ribokinase family [Fusarium oxysporum]|uniref:Ribokinase n=2 Tax=Fusarium oxysporum TaxID=5507 RepID=A0A2H3T1U4_FUSOX|nr:related to sugar kinases, ribokinase family [Fusarium oxysporum]
MPTVRVIGSINADIVSVTPRFPDLGETIQATSFTSSAGGKGANQAVACSRLSRPRPRSSTSSANRASPPITIQMVGAVGGRDVHFQALLKPALEESSVDLSLVRINQDDYTGVSVIIVSEAEGDNRIFFSPGANFSGMQPTPDVIGQALATPMPDVIVMQGETPIETLVAILRELKRLKAKNLQNDTGPIGIAPEVVFNPAPAPPGGLPEDVFSVVDHLIMNETEAGLMAPKPEQSLRLVPDAKHNDPRKQFASYYHELGVESVMVTLGSKGLWYSVAGASTRVAGSSVDGFTGEIPAASVSRVLDTTAAGDTFVGGYATHIARGRHIALESSEEQDWMTRRHDLIVSAMTRAAKAAARCVERSGAMDSIPWEDEL